MTPHDATERIGNSALPLTVDELTVDWLQLAMAEVLRGAKIREFSAEIIGVGEGFMGQLARVRLGYADDVTDAPKSVIAKLPRQSLKLVRWREIRTSTNEKSGFIAISAKA
jgi:hypothetical protein